MKSIFRVIRNIRNEDEKKQEAICFILGDETDFGEECEKNTQEGTKTGGDKLDLEYQRIRRSEDGEKFITI